jgi:uncharacterized oxidoreductase
MKFTNKTILITGATSGIGLELAKSFQAMGNTVLIAGRRQALLDQIAAAHPGIHGYRLDIADPSDIVDFAGQVVADHPSLDVVIHNAGIMVAEQLSATPSDLAISEATIATNLLGPIRLTHALLPHLISRPEAAIMTVTSGLAYVPLAPEPTYCATKAALHSWTESLRVQLANTNIKVIELAPPGVQTDLMPGQRESDFAMPLEDFITEVMHLFETQPDATEIQVENVKFLRYGEARGDYDQVVATLNSRDPHGR